VGVEMSPESLRAYLARFIQALKVQQFSKQTVHSRETYLKRFIRWCNDRGVQTPQDVTKPIIERYQRHLYLYRKTDGEPLSISGQLSYLQSIRAWFKWLSKQNHILYNPASDIELPKNRKRLPKNILTASDAETILNGPDTGTDKGIRDRAILEVLYSTGIRRTELINLKVQDIDYQRGTMLISQGKGHKDRMIPIGMRAIQWINKYKDEVRPELVIGNSHNILFLSRKGEALGSSWLSRQVAKYIDNANIGKTGSCHLFRHTMATLMLENGADIRYIQAMLGHAKLDTTQIYTQVGIQKLKDIHTATHPAKHKP
jgi:integrase/recombinase XerD